MGDLLAISGLRCVFGTRRQTWAVDGVSFHMSEHPGFLNLVGESGSGKTTIARVILGLLRPTEGTALYRGRDIHGSDAAWRREFRHEVQAVFQNPYSAYNPVYRIARVLQVPMRKFRIAGDMKERRDRIAASLRAADLRPEDVLGKYPHQLSGGQRQRVMLARLHLIRPRLIVADEAVSMIDAAGRVAFLNILLDFRDRFGISTLYITHDLSTAQYLGGDIIVLYKGRIVEQGETRQVTARPLHPYARLLIQSVPIADPLRRWTDVLEMTAETSADVSSRRDRCLFAERCPEAMDICWKEQPHLRAAGTPDSSSSQEVACHLY